MREREREKWQTRSGEREKAANDLIDGAISIELRCTVLLPLSQPLLLFVARASKRASERIPDNKVINTLLNDEPHMERCVCE